MAASYETDPAGVMGAPVEIAYSLLTSAGLCSRCRFPRQVISLRAHNDPAPDHAGAFALTVVVVMRCGGLGTLVAAVVSVSAVFPPNLWPPIPGGRFFFPQRSTVVGCAVLPMPHRGRSPSWQRLTAIFLTAALA